MKKLILSALIVVATFSAMAQAPTPPHLASISKVQLNIPQVMSIDSAVNFINNAMVNSNMPSIQVQQLIALNNRAHAPLFDQVRAQVVTGDTKAIAQSDTTKKKLPEKNNSKRNK